ncbi:MAG: hypothetical protein KC800_04685 [Candidatus Eremiobacteraeota bacterium]|nr:hypothetical protein [Candidatus Eremiobacteraeota bacterium]
MGFLQGWRRPKDIERRTFEAIVEDFRKLVGPLRTMGVKLGDAWGQGEPVINGDCVSFNGLGACGCTPVKNALVQQIMSRLLENFVTAPNLQVAAQRTLVEHGVEYRDDHFDIDWGQRRCPGCCTYENFHFPRVQRMRDSPAYLNEAVKTNRRPYDLAVSAFLLIAKKHIGSGFEIHSDGRDAWWDEPRELCQRVLGYGVDMRLESCRAA